MFHIELHQASHRLHRFNLGEQELRSTVLEPWVRGEQVEMGDRAWNPSTASVLVLEGPEIPVGRLTMGRGWSIAAREGAEVTAQVMAGVREALVASAAAAAEAAVVADASGSAGEGATAQAAASTHIAAADAAVLADALGLELLRGLGETPMSITAAWRVAAERHPQMPLGVVLDLARAAVASLTRSRLVRLARAGEPDGQGVQEANLDAALASVDSWTAESGPDALWIRRA
jgi:hypothetical protein